MSINESTLSKPVSKARCRKKSDPRKILSDSGIATATAHEMDILFSTSCSSSASASTTSSSTTGITMSAGAASNPSSVVASSGSSTTGPTSAPGGGGSAVAQQQQQQQHNKEINTATVCRIGQETIQEIVIRIQEVFSYLKSLQPPVGAPIQGKEDGTKVSAVITQN